MDIAMPELNGIEATRQILAETPGTKVIALSFHAERSYVDAILSAGARAYVLKNNAAIELKIAINAIKKGETFLSPRVAHVVIENYLHPAAAPDSRGFSASLSAREREVLQLVAEGKTNKDVAERLHIHARTVESHRAQIMNKLQLRSVAELTKFAIREGLTSVDE
jgi:DNA-binding NarL/FixJ family response regulator